MRQQSHSVHDGERNPHGGKKRDEINEDYFDPEEIALKKFVIRFRGYDTREVETFLRARCRRLPPADRARCRPPTSRRRGGRAGTEVRDELNRLSAQLLTGRSTGLDATRGLRPPPEARAAQPARSPAGPQQPGRPSAHRPELDRARRP